MSSALLLAAGESSRMGQSKPLLDWGGQPLAVYQIHQLLEAGLERVVVVTGYQADAVEAALAPVSDSRLVLVTNPAYALGKVGSVRTGLRALDANSGPILLLSVDQPRPSGLLRMVLSAHEAGEALITVPSYRGRGGHPTIFNDDLYQELLAIEEETLGLRAVVQSHRDHIQRLELDDPTVTLDLNDEVSYSAARAAFFNLPAEL